MSSDTVRVLGVDVGGTKVAVCVADDTGNVLVSGRIPSGATAPYDEVLPRVVELARSLVASLGLAMSDIACCGICAPGPLDMVGGRILKSPNLAWENVPIRDDLAQALGLKAVLENDANAGVLAELYFGSARGKKDVVYLTMSTGVGGGIVSGGKLITGTTGIAGELGHIILDVNGPMCGCGHLGCLEAYCGGRCAAMRLQAKVRFRPDSAIFKLPDVNGKLENITFKTIPEGAKAGIPVAIEMWEEFCMRLAQGIGIIMSTFNPEMIILGTTAYYIGDYMLTPVKEQLRRFTWKEFRDVCPVIITQLGPKIGELAGASAALSWARGAR